jgi:hypothetical protein
VPHVLHVPLERGALIRAAQVHHASGRDVRPEQLDELVAGLKSWWVAGSLLGAQRGKQS